MAYWQLKINLDEKTFIEKILYSNKWDLSTENSKNLDFFDNIQYNEIIFLVDNNQKINYYGRYIKKSVDNKEIQVIKWIKLSTTVDALSGASYANRITQIKNNDKIDELLQAIPDLKTAYKLQNINIHNFRLIEHININFDKSLNIIIANNGIGKTTILDAISIGYGAMLTRFPKIKGKDFKDKDLKRNKDNKSQPFMNIKLASYQNIVWDRTSKRDATKKTSKLIPSSYGLKELNSFVDSIVDKENDATDYIVPLIMYYGTCRNCFDTPMRKTKQKKEFTRFEALNGALTSSTNFIRLFQWFDSMENVELKEQKNRKDFDYTNIALNAVRKAIESMIPTFKNPRIEMYPLRFMIDRIEVDGTVTELQMEQLSAGYRAVLAMTMDISARMVEANPTLGNNSEAIILIDELDLHLHPTWQQTILIDLQRTFPNAQFIITTHSPHIISSVENKYIKILEKNDDTVTLLDGSITYGRKIEWVLMQMGLTSIRPAHIEEKFLTCKSLLDEEKYAEAEKAIDNLEELIKKDDTELMSLRNTLFFQRD